VGQWHRQHGDRDGRYNNTATVTGDNSTAYAGYGGTGNDNNTATATNSGDSSLTLAEVSRFGDNNTGNTGTATNSVDGTVTLALAAGNGDDDVEGVEATATDGQVDIQP
jgi:hypothetical protein